VRPLASIQDSDGAEGITVKPSVLTARQAEILNWVARGKTNEEVARIVGVSPATVKKHLEHIYVRLGVSNRTEAALHARGLGPDPGDD
jgi:DNA-binding CsgD family transcriptional regulator